MERSASPPLSTRGAVGFGILALWTSSLMGAIALLKVQGAALVEGE